MLTPEDKSYVKHFLREILAEGLTVEIKAMFKPKYIHGVTVNGVSDYDILPSYATAGCAALDVRADIENPIYLHSGKRVLIPTGLYVAIPPGMELQVRPRSGMACKYGVTVANSPGTVDSDYRGEVQVCLINHGPETYPVEPGTRIAQLVVAPVIKASLTLVDSLDTTARGAGGFGSTGNQ